MSVKSILLAHRQKERRKVLIMVGVGILTFVSFLFDVATGPSIIPLKSVIEVIASYFFSEIVVEPSVAIIVNDLRLPIALWHCLLDVLWGLEGLGFKLC